MSGVRKSFGIQFNLSSGASRPGYEILVKRYAKRVLKHLRSWFSFRSENGLRPLDNRV